MGRLDLAFFLCCCKACLVSSDQQSQSESFYDILQVDRDATHDELKRAYKRQSLQMHPDKLAQKGKTVTEEDQARFTRMKEAYEVLSDPHKRETYDAIGEKGMKWIDEPLSMDPEEMAKNFASSSTIDRAKIFSIFVFVAVAILIQPILICLQLDGKFGANSKWMAVLTPVWIWSAFLVFYFVRVITMGKTPKPDHIPDSDWVDPMPMPERIISLVRFLLFFAFEIQLALHLDGVNSYNWSIVLSPLFFLEGFTMWKKYPESTVKIVTVEELQAMMGKPIAEFTEVERESVEKSCVVVQNRTCAAFDQAQSQVRSAKQEVMTITLRVVFMFLVLMKINSDLNWSWWFIFSPFFVTSLCICWGKLQDHSVVQASVEEKIINQSVNENNATDYGAMEEGQGQGQSQGQTNATNEELPTPLTQEEMEEMKARVVQSSSRLATSCCLQIFLLILLCLGLSKIQGAGFTTFWLISPFLFVASLILCLLGCMIFCVAPMDGTEEDMYYNMNNPAYSPNTGGAYSAPVASTASAATTASAPVVVPLPPPAATTNNTADAAAATSIQSTPVLVPTPVPPTSTNVTPQPTEEPISKSTPTVATAGAPVNAPAPGLGSIATTTATPVPATTLESNLSVNPSDEEKEPMVTKETIMAPPAPQVDLLDDQNTTKTHGMNDSPQPSDELRELVPTASEVNDLD